METSGVLWLLSWVFLGVSLTLMNKSVFSSLHFPPIALTAVHMGTTWLAVQLYLTFVHARYPLFDQLRVKQLTWPERVAMFKYSCVIAVNVILGNASTKMLSVALSQIIRSTIPAWAAALAFAILGERYPLPRALTVSVVVVGAVLSVAGDVSRWTVLGLCVAFAGCFVAALKGTLQKFFMTGDNLDSTFHPLDLLVKTTGYSAVVCVVLVVPLELGQLLDATAGTPLLFDPLVLGPVFATGVTAFALNLTNVFSTKAVSVVAMAVAGNMRNVLLIFLSLVMFREPVSALNAAGIAITLVGGALFSFVSVPPQPRNVVREVQIPLRASGDDDEEEEEEGGLSDLDGSPSEPSAADEEGGLLQPADGEAGEVQRSRQP